MSEAKPYAQNYERCGPAKGSSSSQTAWAWPSSTKVERQDKLLQKRIDKADRQHYDDDACDSIGRNIF